jgi:hypothetical protein
VRLNPVFLVALSVLSALPLVGCSRKAEQLVGAGRFSRGPGGLGTTVRIAPTADRDTYVEPGTADFDSILLVGTSGLFEAHTFLSVVKWTLPDTTLPGFAAQTISLELPRNLTLGFDPTTVNLSLASAAWDTTNVAWPGPAAGAQLGSAVDDRAAASFSLPLAPGSFPQVVQWAHNPTSIPGFTLQAPPVQALAAYVAGGAKFRIRYSHTVSGAPVVDSVDTRVTQDFYLHSPLSPAPSGADTALAWGGLYKTGLALHFPVDSVPAGVSVDEATLVLRLLPGTAVPDSADVNARVEVRAGTAGWNEAITEQSSLTPGSAVLASGRLLVLYSSTSRSLALKLPGSLMRQWASMPAVNGGILVTLVNRENLTKIFQVGARESATPTELHVTYTQLPPVRF